MSTAARDAGPEPRLDRVVIVGASLAGLRSAEALRRKGFTGELILVGDEVHPPYDRPPLSKEFTAKAMSAESLLRRNLILYGFGGIIAPLVAGGLMSAGIQMGGLFWLAVIPALICAGGVTLLRVAVTRRLTALEG